MNNRPVGDTVFYMILFSVAFAAPAPDGSASIEVDVVGPVAEITVRRAFVHSGPAPVDAELWFAVPPSAVVDRLTLNVGDRRVESRVVARTEAQTVYSAAAAAGQLATVLDHHDPDTVVQRIANVLPGDRVEIELHLVQTLARHRGIWDLVVPLTVAPRLQSTAGVGPTFLLDRPDESVHLSVLVHDELAWIESPSHPYRSTRGPADARLVVEDAAPNRDVTIRWATADQDPHAALWVGQGYGLLQWEAPAPWARAAPAPFDLVLVVDASDSQIGRWPQMLVAVDTLLAALREEDRVTVLLFADRVAGLAVRERVTPDLRRDVAARLRTVSLGGGTGLPHALRFAAALPVPPPRNKTVVVLSDGATDVPLPPVPGATVHAVAIGAAVAHGNLDAVASGVVVTLYPENDPALAVRPVVDALAGPVATELAINWSGKEVVPSPIPPAYPDRSITVLARDVPCASVHLTGRYLGQPFEREVSPRCLTNGRPLEVSWARERVDALTTSGETAAAAQVALDHQIVSPYTSLVGVDTTIRDPDDTSVAVTVPLWAPQDDAITGTWSVSGRSIPAGRSYQVAVSSSVPSDVWDLLPARPSVAFVSLGLLTGPSAVRWERDGIGVTDLVGLWDLDVAGLRGGELAQPNGVMSSRRIAGTNNLEAEAEVHGAWGAGASAEGMRGRLSGPAIRDHLWAAIGFRNESARFAGVESTQDAWSVGGSWYPNSSHQLLMRGFRDASAVAFDGAVAPVGGHGSMLRYGYFPNPQASVAVQASATRQQLDAAWRDRSDVAAQVTVDTPHHRLQVDLRTTRFA